MDIEGYQPQATPTQPEKSNTNTNTTKTTVAIGETAEFSGFLRIFRFFWKFLNK